MKTIIAILSILATVTVAEDWRIVINDPSQTNQVAITTNAPVMSLAGEQRGNAWVVGRENFARDNLNLLLAKGLTLNSFPALVELDSGGAWQYSDAALSNRAQLLAWHLAEINTPVAQYRSLQFYGNAGVALPAQDGHHYQPEYDPASDAWIGVERGSQWVSDPAYTNARNAKLAARAALRAARDAQAEPGDAATTWAGKIAEYKINRDQVSVQLNQYTNHLEQLAVILTTGNDRTALTNAIAALTGNAKTAAQRSLNYEDAKDAKMRQMMDDLKAAAENLRQAMQNLKSATRAGMDGR